MLQRNTTPLIPNRLARRIFLDRQGLITPPTTRQSKTDLLTLIDKLGFVQLDSISTVERAHHMTLFARNQTYKRQHFETLLHDDRALFENWTHDASVIPTRFFPHWQRRFERDTETLRSKWQKSRRKGFEDILNEVIGHITANGPVMSRTFSAEHKKESAGWWNWHPSKTALEYLWRTGHLCVTRREAFQKVYDLTERVIPAEHQGPTSSDEALVDWCCRSALERLGFATPGELAAFWGIIPAAEAQAWARSNAGLAIPRIETQSADGSAPKPCLAHPSILSLSEPELRPPPRLRVISPFDPVVRDRKRLQRLFNFNYRIEVFVPAPKRTYGYYVFPLLEGDCFVGRIDMKRDTKTSTLNVTNVWWEPGIKPSTARLAKLDAELTRIARFVGCDAIEFHT